MRICYVAVDVVIPYFRGASTHTYEVARHLTSLGHEVHVVSRRINAAQPAYELLDSFHVHRIYRGIFAPLPFSKYKSLGTGEKGVKLVDKFYESYLFTVYAFFAGLRTSLIVKRHNIDVIIERETSFGAGAIASMITKKPLILEMIGPRYSKLSLKTSKKILTYTLSMIHDPVSQDKVVLVAAAADVEKFRANSDKARDIRARNNLLHSIVVGYIGTFASWHGIEELVEASVEVTKRLSNVKFLMVGPYFEKTQKLAIERGVADSFVFTGPVPYFEAPHYINAADILVAPYNPAKSELRRKYGIGSPLKVFEYMACEKPVIATSVPPIDRIIRNGENGLMVPPGNSRALADAITYLAENPQVRRELGKRARREVVEKYSWESFAVELDRLLRQVAKR